MDWQGVVAASSVVWLGGPLVVLFIWWVNHRGPGDPPEGS